MKRMSQYHEHNADDLHIGYKFLKTINFSYRNRLFDFCHNCLHLFAKVRLKPRMTILYIKINLGVRCYKNIVYLCDTPNTLPNVL